ncbi:MAG TPA: ferritin-like domain-containing protein [Lacunisphaera sp.]|nr:ferritin-like domain-containing protein [Lacunisphaera sp.]
MPSEPAFQDLFLEELKDIYHAEQQLVKALPKMAKAATARELKDGFTKHLKETEGHTRRLEKIFTLLGHKPAAKVCEGMKGLIKEGQEKIEEDVPDTIRDAALIGAAQKVEHYEIAAYGTLRTYADLMDRDDIVELLQETLDEEGVTDKKLTEIAETLNVEAVMESKT